MVKRKSKTEMQKKAMEEPVNADGLTAEEVVARARVLLLRQYPFFGSIALKRPSIFTRKIPTAGVCATQQIFYNPDFMCALSYEDAVAVVAHECMHVVQSVFDRFPIGGNMLIWNLAADHIVNTALHDAGMAFGPLFRSLTPQEILDAAHKDELTEVRYNNLLKEETKNASCPACKKILQDTNSAGDDSQGDGGSGEDDEKQDAQDGQGGNGDEHLEDMTAQGHSFKDGKLHYKGTPHSCGGFDMSGDLVDPSHIKDSTTRDDIKERIVNDIVAAAQEAEASDSRGNIPGVVNNFLTEMRKPSVSWKDIIRAKAHKHFKNRYTLRRPSRRGGVFSKYGETEYRLPAKEADETKGCIVMIDTSGSISDTEIHQFVSEIVGIMHQCNCPKVYIMFHDTSVYHADTYEEKDMGKIKVTRGGTSHIHCFEIIEGEDENYEIPFEDGMIVAFTDMESCFPDTCSLDTVWACTRDHYIENNPAPFGDIVEVELNEG